jgi:hypothetical protein
VLGEGVLTSRSQSSKGGFTVLGQPLAGGCTQTRESRMVAVAASFVLSRPVSWNQSVDELASFNSSGSKCTTLQGETIHIAAYSVMHNPTFLLMNSSE